MALHIRILWGLLNANQVPKDPAEEILNDFNVRFSNETQLYDSQRSGRELIPRHLIRFGTAMSAERGRPLTSTLRYLEMELAMPWVELVETVGASLNQLKVNGEIGVDGAVRESTKATYPVCL